MNLHARDPHHPLYDRRLGAIAGHQSDPADEIFDIEGMEPHEVIRACNRGQISLETLLNSTRHSHLAEHAFVQQGRREKEDKLQHNFSGERAMLTASQLNMMDETAAMSAVGRGEASIDELRRSRHRNGLLIRTLAGKGVPGVNFSEEEIHAAEQEAMARFVADACGTSRSHARVAAEAIKLDGSQSEREARSDQVREINQRDRLLGKVR